MSELILVQDVHIIYIVRVHIVHVPSLGSAFARTLTPPPPKMQPGWLSFERVSGKRWSFFRARDREPALSRLPPGRLVQRAGTIWGCLGRLAVVVVLVVPAVPVVLVVLAVPVVLVAFVAFVVVVVLVVLVFLVVVPDAVFHVPRSVRPSQSLFFSWSPPRAP